MKWEEITLIASGILFFLLGFLLPVSDLATFFLNICVSFGGVCFIASGLEKCP